MSSPITITPANTEEHYQQVRQLIEEYAASRNFDAALQGIHKELERLPEYYPLILLAYWKEQTAGCVAIQALEEDICEMKRLYVSPAFQGLGLGHSLVAQIIEGARKLGFQWMRLDTHPSMVNAQNLYAKFGFTEIERYNKNPIPGIRFFELQLSDSV